MDSRRPRYLTFLVRWGPVLLWIGVIFVFSADSNPYHVLPSNWESACQTIRLGALCQDEMLGRFSHVTEYALLALLICRGVFWEREVAVSGLLLSAGMALACALLDEMHQLFVPARTFQFADLILDGLGILIGLLIFTSARHLRRRHQPQPE